MKGEAAAAATGDLTGLSEKAMAGQQERILPKNRKNAIANLK